VDNTKTTLIANTSYIVGFTGTQHFLLKKGELAYKGNEVIYVGKSFPGQADEIIDAQGGFVIPGLINLHCHIAASPVEKGFLEDTGNPNLYMTGLYEYLRVTHITPEDQMKVFNFSLSDILTKGSTTIFELGLGTEEMVEAIGNSGIRAYIGLMARSGVFMSKDGRKVHYEWDEPEAFRRLAVTLQRREKYDDSFSGRIKIALYPGQVDTCTPDFLREIGKVASQTKMCVATHAAQTVNEYQIILEKYGRTPADFLTENGIAGPRVMYGHYILPSGHSMNALKIGNELKTIADAGTSIVHCPWGHGRRGIIMESFNKYLDLGINLCLGTDTFPQDMINEMRCAAVFCKIAEANPNRGTAAQIFNAATLGGAKALGRDDIGRLSPGAKADIVIIDTNNLETCPLRDPIKVLIYTASSRNISKVIVDGNIIVENGIVKNMDEQLLIKDMQAVAERMWENVKNKDWGGRSHLEMSPMSFPVVE
jgi:cytosine/adenosine deaminase-related metal-dependent hydrolase